MSNTTKDVIIRFTITGTSVESVEFDKQELFETLDEISDTINADINWQEITHSR